MVSLIGGIYTVRSLINRFTRLGVSNLIIYKQQRADSLHNTECMESIIQHEKTRIQKRLTSQQMRAIVMRTEGAKFREISEFIEVPENTVKNWFRVGTDVYGVFKEYSGNVAYSIGIDAESRLRVMVDEATDTLKELMGSEMPPAVRLRASLYVLDKSASLMDKDREERKTMPEKLLFIYKKAHENLETRERRIEDGYFEIERLMDIQDEINKFI